MCVFEVTKVKLSNIFFFEKKGKNYNLLGARSAMGLTSSGGRAKRASFGDRFF